ncbi:MAG: competence protein ComEC [Pseudonocardiales bacterium]|nr:competence protein ComEC [Pseudonocardiales bacterium]
MQRRNGGWRSCADTPVRSGESAQDHFVGVRSGAARAAGVDLRLCLGAAGAWLGLLLCFGRSPGVDLTVAGTACVIGVAGLLAARRHVRAAAAIALVAFCIALVVIPFAGRVAHSRASPLAQLARQHVAVTIELKVTADPRPLAAKGVSGSPRSAVVGRASSLLVAGRRVAVSGQVVVLAPAQLWRDVLPGQRVRLDGRLQPALDAGSLSVTLFAQSDPVLLGSPPWWQRAAGTVRTSLRRAAAGLPEGPRGLLPGLIDGDTTELDPVLAERFRMAGLTHLVAVSGTNCSILVGAVLLALRRARARPWVCAVLGGLVLLGFIIVARPSPSVLRAAVMASIALAALAGGRPRQALPSVAAAVLALLLWDPGLADDPGFAMSVLATCALLVLAPSWADALRRRRVPALAAEGIAVAAAAHLVTAPVIAAISGRVSLVAIPANVLAEPVVVAVTVLGFIAAVLSPLWMPAAQLFAQLAGWPCRWLVLDADFFGGLHGATVPWPGGVSGGMALLGVAVGLVLAAHRAGPRRALAASAAIAVVVLIPVRAAVSGWPPAGWALVACDVGQGDALVLRAGPGSAVVIDTGPDPVAVDRCLRDLGVADVPLLAISHYHLDHVAGIVGVFHGRHVGRVITGPLAQPFSGEKLVHDTVAAHRLGVGVVAAGQAFDVGRVHLEVLGPAVAFRDTRSDPNNSSLVLRATVGGERVLLPGDAEVEAQQALLADGLDLRADVLKVPHHGSAYSWPAFLAAVHAKIAVISVGLHNDYGHPSPLLLAELARLAVPVRRTDHDGDVALVVRDGTLTAVLRGTRASTVGLGGGTTAPLPVGAATSAVNARMGPCLLARSPSTICRQCYPAWCCSSVTRSCSSGGPSARSPPPRVAMTRASASRNGPAPRSRGLSCTRCWARRCSVTPGWS